jgi:hypothetical protein
MMFIVQIDRNPKLRAKITILINCANPYEFSRNMLAVQIASAHNHASTKISFIKQEKLVGHYIVAMQCHLRPEDREKLETQSCDLLKLELLEKGQIQ